MDTNVVSEPLKFIGDPVLIHWLDEQDPETLFFSSVSLAEILTGVLILPEGKRKQGLSRDLSQLLDRLFGSHILPFDEDAATAYASIVSRARLRGRSISLADGQIAAIAQVHGFTVATRDVSPFLAAAVPVINPWQTQIQ